jgi:hypothetical protein
MGLFDQDEEEPVVADPVDKNRLFETLEEESGASRKYIKVFSIVVVCVIIAGAVLYYLLMPGIGEQVRATAAMEDAVRNNFTDVQKRTATDITFYKCDGYYWARVDVEVRSDIQTNPVYKYPQYRARISGDEPNWQITATPITDSGQDVPCNF